MIFTSHSKQEFDGKLVDIVVPVEIESASRGRLDFQVLCYFWLIDQLRNDEIMLFHIYISLILWCENMGNSWDLMLVKIQEKLLNCSVKNMISGLKIFHIFLCVILKIDKMWYDFLTSNTHFWFDIVRWSIVSKLLILFKWFNLQWHNQRKQSDDWWIMVSDRQTPSCQQKALSK